MNTIYKNYIVFYNYTHFSVTYDEMRFHSMVINYNLYGLQITTDTVFDTNFKNFAVKLCIINRYYEQTQFRSGK